MYILLAAQKARWEDNGKMDGNLGEKEKAPPKYSVSFLKMPGFDTVYILIQNSQI